MPFKYVCVNCAKAMTAEDSWAGTRRSCPHCGQDVLFRRDRHLHGAGGKPVSSVRPGAEPEAAPSQIASKPHARLAVASKRPVPPPSLCPRCHHPLAGQAVVCRSCGFDRSTGTGLGPEVELASPSAETGIADRACVDGTADSPCSPGLALAPGAGRKPEDVAADTARKEFRSLGWSVIILGLLSLLFLDGVKKDIVPVAWLVIGACVVFGGWQVVRPSVPIGLLAGLSLALLGVIDLILARKSGGLGFVAPLIDFGFAVRVFVGCAKYARS